MTEAVLLVAGAFVFFLGFLLGNAEPKKRKAQRLNDRARICATLPDEYENFLSYDGSLKTEVTNGKR